MPTQISPGVLVNEIDLTAIVPAVATTEGGIAGVFRWGPIDQRILVDNETKLVTRFGKPTNLNPETFFTAANFLAYGNRLYISRAANTTGGTANDVMSAVANVGTITTPIQFNIKNEDHYIQKMATGGFSTDLNVLYAAKYPGDMGNTLKISVCDSATSWKNSLVLASNAQINSIASAVTANLGSSTITVTLTAANSKSSADLIAVDTRMLSLTSSILVGDYLEVGNVAVGKQMLKIQSIGATTNTYSTTTSTLSFAASNTTVTLTAGNTSTFAVGMSFSGLNIAANTKIAAITNSTVFTITAAPTGVSSGSYDIIRDTATVSVQVTSKVRTKKAIADTSLTRYWEYFGAFNKAPERSKYISNLYQENSALASATANDELHLVVVDEDGIISGVPGTILEKFEGLSRIPSAKNENGSSIYYGTALTQGSQYVWWTNDRTGASSASATAITSSTNDRPLTLSFSGGQDGLDESTIDIVNLYNAWDKFVSTEQIDVSLLLQGKAVGGINGEQLANYVIDNIVGVRKDAVFFVSPSFNAVVNNPYQETDATISFRNAITSSSFAVMDCGYKYQYDRYNDVYRWVPLNGDVGGLCARTDQIADAWYSPAGYNRGLIKNVVKLAYNPTQSERDSLYKADVNPVINVPGTGPMLYGDKTLFGKPSAFDRINVRRLFIVLEKAISRASKYMLFEFNDSFTRSQFKNLIEPYLRDIQGRRGIFDFKVICDETNNTGEVIDRNEFIGDIYIKPARSINYIQLNFIAVRTGVSFNEIIGLRT